MSKPPLSDADIIKMIGTKAIIVHFGVGASAVSQWKTRGIPTVCRKPMILLGESLGYDMAEMKSVLLD